MPSSHRDEEFPHRRRMRMIPLCSRQHSAVMRNTLCPLLRNRSIVRTTYGTDFDSDWSQRWGMVVLFAAWLNSCSREKAYLSTDMITSKKICDTLDVDFF